MEHITHNNKAFTLIELLISVSVFALVITAAIGIFLSSMKGKERVNQLKEIEDNARYTMEIMSREVRAGFIPDSQSGNSDSDLTFIDANGNAVTYNLIGTSLAKDGSSITSNRVKVDNLKFYVNDFAGNNLQPRVTISMTVDSTADNSVSMDFQTTVSSKIPSPKLIFVTSQKYDSDFNGLNGADRECQVAASNAGLLGTYKALMGDRTTSIADRIPHNPGPYFTINGNKIADNFDDLFDGDDLYNPVNIDEFGNLVVCGGGNRVWTGYSFVTADGCAQEDCFWWTGGGDDGNAGWCNRTDNTWIETFALDCSFTAYLYCVQQ